MPDSRAVRAKSIQGRKVAQRRKLGVPVVPRLSEDAPLGTYMIDYIADELLALSARSTDRIEFIATIRTKINIAAKMAITGYECRYVWEPRQHRAIKRLFADIELISKLIGRNKTLDSELIWLATKQLRPGSYYHEIGDFLAALDRAADAIKKFQCSWAPRKRGGNYDPLTDEFIQNVYDLWCDRLSIGRNDKENQLFLRFLSAAWRDVHFPTRDDKGQLLENWLGDRVRKKFVRGICDSRVQQQGLYEMDWEYSTSEESSC
jgi:hypothetical protein